MLDIPCHHQVFGIWYLIFCGLSGHKTSDALGRFMRCLPLPLPLPLRLSFAAHPVSVRHACIRYYLIVKGLSGSVVWEICRRVD